MLFKKADKKRLKYENLLLLFASTAVAVYILISPQLADFLTSLGSFGYAGVLIAGAFFTYMFTTPIATAVLFMLSGNLDPLTVGIIGGAGAMVSDLIIFKFIRSSISFLDKEIYRVKEFVRKHNPIHLRKENYLWERLKKYFVFVLAGFIIASPLPDEIGVAMLGASDIKTWKFMLFSFVFNSIGIFLIATAAHVI